MTAKRKRLPRLPKTQITPEVLWAFQQIKKLETQCTCADSKDECAACKAWWGQHVIIHRALHLPPYFWPCLPPPGDKVVSAGARSLYAELDAAAG